MTNNNCLFERRIRAAYGMLLRSYPAHFRDLYALDMEETFADQLRQARREGVVRC